MPNKYDFIKFTFDDISKEITKSPENWQSFLFRLAGISNYLLTSSY